MGDELEVLLDLPSRWRLSRFQEDFNKAPYQDVSDSKKFGIATIEKDLGNRFVGRSVAAARIRALALEAATLDGVPVLIHDPVIDRVTNGSGAVADYTLAEVQRFDAGYRFSPDGGQTHPYRGRGLSIPGLDEVFDAFPGARFNLELKDALPQIVNAAVERVAKHHREALTLLTAGDDEIMREIRARLDRHAVPIAQGASEGDVLAFIRSAIRGERARTGSNAGSGLDLS